MIPIRYDQERGCGWRKPGGLYFVSKGLTRSCGAFPMGLSRCPCCGNGIKPARGFTWVDAGMLLAPSVALCGGPPAASRGRDGETPSCGTCPLPKITGQQGLVWIGERFYRDPEDFKAEAARLGVSRRITRVPRGFVIGETWVFVAHRAAISTPCPSHYSRSLTTDEMKAAADKCECGGSGILHRPGIFHAFRPSGIEYVVKGTETDDELTALLKRGITPVTVVRVKADGVAVEP